MNSLITTREGGGGPHDFFFNDHPHDCFKILIKIIYQSGSFELLDDCEGGCRGSTCCFLHLGGCAALAQLVCVQLHLVVNICKYLFLSICKCASPSGIAPSLAARASNVRMAKEISSSVGESKGGRW